MIIISLLRIGKMLFTMLEICKNFNQFLKLAHQPFTVAILCKWNDTTKHPIKNMTDTANVLFSNKHFCFRTAHFSTQFTLSSLMLRACRESLCRLVHPLMFSSSLRTTLPRSGGKQRCARLRRSTKPEIRPHFTTIIKRNPTLSKNCNILNILHW